MRTTGSVSISSWNSVSTGWSTTCSPLASTRSWWPSSHDSKSSWSSGSQPARRRTSTAWGRVVMENTYQRQPSGNVLLPSHGSSQGSPPPAQRWAVGRTRRISRAAAADGTWQSAPSGVIFADQMVSRPASRQTSSARGAPARSTVWTVVQVWSAVRPRVWCMALASAVRPSDMSRSWDSMSPSV